METEQTLSKLPARLQNPDSEMEVCLNLPEAQAPTPLSSFTGPNCWGHPGHTPLAVRATASAGEQNPRGEPNTDPCGQRALQRGPGERQVDRQGARGGTKHPPGPPPPPSRRCAGPPLPRSWRAVSPPRGAISPHACDGGYGTQQSPACPHCQAVSRPLRKPGTPALLWPPRHPHLPCRPWRAGKPGGIGLSFARGAGRLRALALRARPLLFPAAPE